MKKELVVFLVTIVVLAGLWFLSGDAAVTRGGGRGTRGAEAPAPPAARSTPGRFIPEAEVTWAATAGNIFETPTETRDLAPLDLAPPPFPRLPHPGAPLPFPIGLKSRGGFRRVIVPNASAPPPADGTNGGGGGEAGTGGSATNPATPTTSDPLVPLGRDLGAIDRIKLSLEAELRREQDAALAKENEEDRKKRLDRITLTTGTVIYGEMTAVSTENRYAIKRELDQTRTDAGLTEPDRNDKLKKLKVMFRQDRRGKLGRADTFPGDTVASVTFAETPENRYRQRLLEVAPTDLAQQLELAKIVFDARLFPLAVQHLGVMKKNGLSSPEMMMMLADAQHEVFQYNEELEVLRKATVEFPDSAPLLARLGRLQTKLGMSQNAKESFAAALAKNPNDSLANAGMGEVLLKEGDAQRAIPNLREALNLAGSDSAKVDAMRLLLAEGYLRLGDFRNAHEAVDLVLQRANINAPERARTFERAYTLSTIAALGQGQLAEARTRAEEGARKFPLSGHLSYLLGVVMAQQGELQACRSRLTVAAELDPLLTGHVQAAIAMVEEAAASDDNAVASAESGALIANPSAFELRLPLGRALLHVGDLARAREQLLFALDYEPKSADALIALGDAHYSGGELTEAMRFYDRAASIEATFPQLLARRIITQVRRRKLADVDDLASKVVTNDLKDPFMQAALAYFQYAKGNQAEALASLQKLGETDTATLGDYAKSANAALTTHQNKVMWNDSFSRTGAQIGREWNRDIGAGITTALQNQSVGFDGTQRGLSDKPTMLWQERPGERMYGFSVDLDLQPQSGVYAGIGVMAMNQGIRNPENFPGKPERPGGLAPYTGMQVALSPEAVLVYRLLVKGKMGEWTPVPVTSYAGGPVTMEIRFADPKEGVLEVLINREPVLKQTFADFKKFKRTVELQIVCQAQIDRKVHFTADNVVIVTLKEPK